MNELYKYMQNNDTSCLLLQNLPNIILNKMLSEIDSVEKDDDKEEASSLLLAVLSLSSGSIIDDNISSQEIYIDADDLMSKLNDYTICVELENMRRSKKIFMTDESLPTLKNIFDKNKKLQISGLD